MSRFMADNDQPDQLVLSLYGMLAIGMTPGTYISGEAISVVPVDGAYYRSMYMPPNSARTRRTSRRCARCSSTSGADRERRADRARPGVLDAAGVARERQDDRVDGAPTSFGPVSYSIARTGIARSTSS